MPQARLRQGEHPARLAAALVATNFAGRLLLARHWLLDAVGGLLAALALTGLALPTFRRRPLFAPAALALTLAAVPAVQSGELHEIKSCDILQPGPAALTDGLAQLHAIFARWQARQQP